MTERAKSNQPPKAQREGLTALIGHVRSYLSQRCRGGLDETWSPLGMWPGDVARSRRDGGRTRGLTMAPMLMPGADLQVVQRVRVALLDVLTEYGQRWDAPIGDALSAFARMRKELDDMGPTLAPLRAYLQALTRLEGATVGDEGPTPAPELGAAGIAHLEAVEDAVEAMARGLAALDHLLRRPLREAVREGDYEGTANVPLNRMCELLDAAEVDRAEIARVVGLARGEPDESRERVRQRLGDAAARRAKESRARKP